MSLILCIEAGTDVGSVALARDGQLVSLLESTQSREHAQNLAVYVDEILHENNIDPDDLSAVAIGKGPGSYTGLRIAVSLAKGICYGAQIPLIAVNSLESLCYVAIEDFEAGILDIEDIENATLLPMFDARRMEVYCQLFAGNTVAKSVVEAHILNNDSFKSEREAGDLLLFGDGAVKCKDIFTEPNVHFLDVVPSARGLVKPAFEAFKASQFEDIAYFEPLYLKDFLVTTSQKKLF